MKTIRNPILRVFAVILMAAFIFILAGSISDVLARLTNFPEALEEGYFGLLLIVFSVLASLIFSKGNLSTFGFIISNKGYYGRVILIILTIEIISSVILSFVTISGEEHFVANYSLLRTIYSVWIIASISEEVLTRGFIQGYLQALSSSGIRIGKFFISLPVIVGAFFFMSMHIFIILEGIDHNLFIYILISTFILGIVAGYFREKTGSLLPAILAHMCSNIFPFVIESLVESF
jgi:CAAX protease family protein